MNIHIPTTKEIYMIAYLTSHGWELSYDGYDWTKPGFKQKKYGLDCIQVEVEEFNLEDAYWAEREAQEKK